MPKSANWDKIVSICGAEGFPDVSEVYEKCMLMFNKYRYIKWHKQQSPPKKKSRKEIEKERRELRRRFLDLFWKPLKGNEQEMEALVEDAMKTSWFDDLLAFAIDIISFFDKGKIYIGSSAGSQIIGSTIELCSIYETNNVNMTDFTALGIVNKEVVPHANKKEELLKNCDKEELILLYDGDGIIIN